MALTKSTITGRVPLPTDVAAKAAELIFTLSSWDTQGADVIAPATVRAILGLDASLPAGFALWRNTEGLRGSHYIVTARWTEEDRSRGAVSRETRLGNIQIGDDASYPLAVLLERGIDPAPPSFWVAASAGDVQTIVDAADALSGFTEPGYLAEVQEGAGLANGAATRAEAAADAALGAAGWDQSVPDEAARLALTGLPANWRVYQIAPAPGRIWRWTGTAWADTGENPLAGKADQVDLTAEVGRTSVIRASLVNSTAIFGPANPTITGDTSGSRSGAVMWSNQYLPRGWPRRIKVGILGPNVNRPNLVLFFGPASAANRAQARKIIVKNVSALPAGVITLQAGVDFEPFEITGDDWRAGTDRVRNGGTDQGRFVAEVPETGVGMYFMSSGSPVTIDTEMQSTSSSANVRLQIQVEVDEIDLFDQIDGLEADKAEAYAPLKPLLDRAAAANDWSKIFTQTTGYISPAGVVTPVGGNNRITPMMECWEGVTFTGDHVQGMNADGIVGRMWGAFFDAGGNYLPPAKGSAVITAGFPAGYLQDGMVIMAPAGTARVVLHDYFRGNNYGRFGLRMDAVGMRWYEEVFRKYFNGERTFSLVGDSHIGNFSASISRFTDKMGQEYILNHNGVGGENVFDSCWRAGAIPLIVKGPVTVPADGSPVTVNAVRKFRETRAVDPLTGEYTLAGATHSAMATGSYAAQFRYKGVALLLNKSGPNPAPVWSIQLAAAQAQPLVITGDLETFGQDYPTYAREPRGFGIGSLGTNGGFAASENTYWELDPAGDPERLFEVQRRMAQLFDGKYLPIGNWVGGLNRVYNAAQGLSAGQVAYEAMMETEFGSRWLNGRNLLLTEAVRDLKMIITSDLLQAMGRGYPPLPFIPDLTHLTQLASRWLMQKAFQRAEQLGWIDRAWPLLMPLPASLALASSAGTSLTVGATTTLTVSSPTAGLIGGAMSSPIITTSNPAVISLPAVGAGTLATNNLTNTIVLTAAGAGTATVTVQARFGGVTQAINFTVS